MKKAFLAISAALTLLVSCSRTVTVIDLSDYGIVPGSEGLTDKLSSVIRDLRESHKDSLVLKLKPGRYDFYPSGASVRECFISNHGRFEGSVGIDIDGLSHLTLDGCGADMVFHGSMLPVRLVRSENCTLKDFSIDVAEPLADIGAVVTGPDGSAPELDILYDNPDIDPFFAMVVDRESHHIVYNTGDVRLPYDAPEGSVLIMRSGVRPCPAVFLDDDVNATLASVSVYGAHGMGVLAQMCHNVNLEGCSVVPRDGNHYMSALCDATHFSQCSGAIISTGGHYEAMGDDAINVHGIGLSVAEIVDGNTMLLRFCHHETFGLEWGRPGDEIQFLAKKTSLPVGSGRIAAIRALDIKTIEIKVEGALPSGIESVGDICVENLTRTASVVFSDNHVGNNRARGALFTTPRSVVVSGNSFDHVPGTAILISGDCNSWYETGACHDVLITDNEFINCLTCLYGGCEAVISIAPEISDIQAQGEEYYHSGIRIENNRFLDFGSPLIYARSVKGLSVEGNVLEKNSEYPPLFPEKSVVTLSHVEDSRIQSFVNP